MTDVIGVVADSREEAIEACKMSMKVISVLSCKDGGHVRFIRHTMRGPDTKVSVHGHAVSETDATQK